MARTRRTGRPIVLLHIGETKTGTTFLQDVMWANRTALAGHGVLLPGFHAQDHHRAARDLRGLPYDETDPRGTWVGEWDVLARQASAARSVAVISQEALIAAGRAGAERAVRSLEPAEVHLAVTVRDLASLLPAEWQENVKNGGTHEWPTWLATVLDRSARTPAPARTRFWRLHGTVVALRLWNEFVPADRIHVVVVPPADAGPDALWHRWAALLGVPPEVARTDAARANRSLSYAETEFLRRVNLGVKGRVPPWFYESQVKAGFAEGLLPGRTDAARPPLTPHASAWTARYAERLIRALDVLQVDVVGDPAQLRPVAPGPAAVTEASIPGDVLAAIGARAVSELLVARFEHPEGPRRTAGPVGSGWRDRAIARIGSSERTKRAIRVLTARYPAVARLRVVAWRLTHFGRR